MVDDFKRRWLCLLLTVLLLGSSVPGPAGADLFHEWRRTTVSTTNQKQLFEREAFASRDLLAWIPFAQSQGSPAFVLRQQTHLRQKAEDGPPTRFSGALFARLPPEGRASRLLAILPIITSMLTSAFAPSHSLARDLYFGGGLLAGTAILVLIRAIQTGGIRPYLKQRRDLLFSDLLWNGAYVLWQMAANPAARFLPLILIPFGWAMERWRGPTASSAEDHLPGISPGRAQALLLTLPWIVWLSNLAAIGLFPQVTANAAVHSMGPVSLHMHLEILSRLLPLFMLLSVYRLPLGVVLMLTGHLANMVEPFVWGKAWDPLPGLADSNLADFLQTAGYVALGTELIRYARGLPALCAALTNQVRELHRKYIARWVLQIAAAAALVAMLAHQLPLWAHDRLMLVQEPGGRRQVRIVPDRLAPDSVSVVLSVSQLRLYIGRMTFLQSGDVRDEPWAGSWYTGMLQNPSQNLRALAQVDLDLRSHGLWRPKNPFVNASEFLGKDLIAVQRMQDHIDQGRIRESLLELMRYPWHRPLAQAVAAHLENRWKDEATRERDLQTFLKSCTDAELRDAALRLDFAPLQSAIASELRHRTRPRPPRHTLVQSA